MADRIHGVDISEYQPNWKPTKIDTFCFIKASEGQSWKSRTIGNQVKVARDADLVVGYYHFLWPSKASGSPQKQAAWFLSCIPSLRSDEILVCDWEGTGGGTPSQADKNAFMAEVAKRRPDNRLLLYVNRSMWNASDKKAHDGLWLAEYARAPTVSGWKFWQYTDKPIDKNWGAFPTKAALQAWAAAKSKPSTPPSSQEGLLDMATRVAASASTDQKLVPKDTYTDLKIDEKGAYSVVSGTTKDINVAATVHVEGMKPGEVCDLAWRIASYKKDTPTTYPHTRKADRCTGTNNALVTRQVVFDGGIPAFDGRDGRLRLSYKTNSKTAVVTAIQIIGRRT